MEKLKVNGIEKNFDVLPKTLSQLLEMLTVDAAVVVAEIDGKIIEKEKFSETALQKGQNIELVRFVPGG